MIKEEVKNLNDINQLLETLKLVYEDGKVVCDLEPHIARLRNSIKELGFVDISNINDFRQSVLEIDPQEQDTGSVCNATTFLADRKASDFSSSKSQEKDLKRSEMYRVRILYNRDGSYEVQHIPFEEKDLPEIIKLKILDYGVYHVESSNPIHKHKYLPRPDFSEHLKDCDEVVWLNERYELCEGSRSSIFFFDGGEWHTPSLDCGILRSITRKSLITKLNAKEGFYKIEDLKKARKIIRTSAVIGKREAVLI